MSDLTSAAPVTRRPLVIVAVMLSMFMIAIEATIISTAMPQIVGDLGGLTLFSWVFSGFLLAQAAATVIFGKLSDVYGRKPAILVGIGFFLLGSGLCGFAWSMGSLIAFRLLQGIGAGAIQPVAQTLVGDFYTAQERGRVQGLLASVWAVSAVLGPLVGALIIERASWAWIFWINIPVGLLAVIGYVFFLREDVTRSGAPADVLGAALFTLGIGALMVALTEAGHGDYGVAAVSAIVFAASGAAFLWQERRASAPMIALELWSRRAIAACNGVSLLAGMALIGLTTFLPIYVQGILRQTPVVAGLALTVMVLGWPLGAIISAKTLGRIRIRTVLVLGSTLLPVGALAFPLLTPEMPALLAGAGSLVMGLGMGILSTSSIVLIQEIVPWSERGSATASLVFSRNLGSTLGAAVLGAILNFGLARPGAPVSSEELQRILSTGERSGEAETLRATLQLALHHAFWAVFAISVAATVAALLVPHIKLGRKAEAAAAS